MQYLKGITFPLQIFQPSEWGGLFEKILADGILRGCAVTGSGTNVSVASGLMIICGRLIAVSSTTTEATSPTYPDGYGRLKVVIDTSQTSSETVNHQAYIEVDYSATQTFPALVRNDINGSGTKYEAVIGIIKYSGGAISSISSPMGAVLGTNKALMSNADGRLEASDVTATELNRLSGVTANVQTQLNGKQSKVTWGTGDPTGGSVGDIYIKIAE